VSVDSTDLCRQERGGIEQAAGRIGGQLFGDSALVVGIARRYGYDFALQWGPRATVRMIPEFLSEFLLYETLSPATDCLPTSCVHRSKTSHLSLHVSARLSLVGDAVYQNVIFARTTDDAMLTRPQASLDIHLLLVCKTTPSLVPILYCMAHTVSSKTLPIHYR
jgi:hypothetical protein